MISAHIYSNEALPRPQERAVRDGLEMVADHIGERLVARHYRLVLPTNVKGHLDPYTYDAFPRAEFDKNVDLHVILARLASTESLEFGLSYFGTGVSFVEFGLRRKELSAFTAHETAHSLDFVLPNVFHQKDRHCKFKQCVMQAVVELVNKSDGDFCKHCQSDMTSHGLTHLERLREVRSHQHKLTLKN